MTARRNNTGEQTARVLELVKRGTYAAARADRANAESKAAEAALQQAKAELDRARESLGPQGAENPQLREAMAVLQKAQLNLGRTNVLAPSDGLVTNLQLTNGQQAGAGQPLLTFIDIRDYWVSAEFRVNSLGNVKPGDQAEMVFDVLPGRIYRGTVINIAHGGERLR